MLQSGDVFSKTHDARFKEFGMTTELLQRHIHRTPFVPFILRLADGQQLHVPHPDFISHAPGTRTASVALRDGSFEYDDLLLVVGLITDQPAAARDA
jgi:hypothetical protein